VLRPYQETAKSEIYEAWRSGHRNVLLRLPTGAGKTVTFCSVTHDLAVLGDKLPTAILVHRKELIQQISLTLAGVGITHNIIAPRPVIAGIVAAQRRLTGRQYYNHAANITVVSVDTFNARIEKHGHKIWAEKIRLWITDEAAHLLENNKWGSAVKYFPNAIGLGVTATPQRLDKKGLGRHADGVFDVMVEGPDTRWLIDNGFLCKYKIAIPKSDYRNFLKRASDGSDYSKDSMIQASQRSHIVGDVVLNYEKFAGGKQAILFASDVNTGTEMEKKFIAAGITAKILSAETDDKERLEALIDYRNKKIKVLLNVDLFDEGLDVPGIECVIMARPTKSLGKYLQMVGRGLRTAPDKEHLMLIDHVGNVDEHSLPCSKRKWTLDRIVKRRDKTNFHRVCSNTNCNSPYDRHLTECPWCGTEAVSGHSRDGGGRVPPIQVDGDLELIDPETLRELEANTVLEDPGIVGNRVAFRMGANIGKKAMKDQAARIATQRELVHVIAHYAGKLKQLGYTDRQINKRFYLDFDGTISEKLAEPRAEMILSMERIKGEYE
jgi:superfamily II DNA or RNA helicase